MTLVDTHCHLYDERLARDLAGVVARALDAGVAALIVPGVTLETSRTAVALAERFSAVFAAVGIHPEAVTATLGPEDLRELARLADHSRVVAVGEVGLDRSPGRPDLALQEQVFGAQVDLAREKGLPLLVHSRDATGRTLALLQERLPEDGSGPGGILHAWVGAPETAQRLALMGFRFGVAGVICRQAARRVRARIAALPLELLVLETDAPYIGTGTTFRGEVEPAALPEIRDSLAALLGLPPKTVEKTTTNTARALLGLPE